MFTVLRASRPVRVLYIARGISEIGNWCANIALPMLIYEVTHDVSATALMVCCRFAPLSVFSCARAAASEDGYRDAAGHEIGRLNSRGIIRLLYFC